MAWRSVGAVFCCLLLTSAALAAEGTTAAERRAVTELHRQLRRGDVPAEAARTLARIYARRAYVVELEPAQKLAMEISDPERRLAAQHQFEFYAESLDALIRGAKLDDLLATFKQSQELMLSAGNKRLLFLTGVRNADHFRSALPLVQLADDLDRAGAVGTRFEDTIRWAASQLERGESAEHIARLYKIISDVTPSYSDQRDFLTECYRHIRRGVPPYGLVQAVERLATRYESARLMNENLDRLIRLYRAGRTLEEATTALVPPEAD